ncbi:MAG TPA: prolyl oligopeptidase family serine peptidase [Patescibacteria group bacterium]|nr:prolyl oligopeptidase family serine peptidase [Patescibacteria group bacterium]
MKKSVTIFIKVVWLFLVFWTISIPVVAQEELLYQMPPKEIVALVDAPNNPFVISSPDAKILMIVERPVLPSIREVAQPELKLAGLRINPRTNGPSLSRTEYYKKIIFKDLNSLREYPLSGLPMEARISNMEWSPDSQKVAFTITQSDGIELWIASSLDGKVLKLTGPVLNGAMEYNFFQWLSDSRHLVCNTVPQNRLPLPQKDIVPKGPVVQSNEGTVAPVRTFQDLLKDKYDEVLFTYYTTSQLAIVDLDGNIQPVGEPAIIAVVDPSPNGNYILVNLIKPPFSYLVSFAEFPQSYEIWDRQGKLVKKIADVPLAEDVPSGNDAVRKGPRAFAWRNDHPAWLCWVEAQDAGDPAKEAEIRDKVFFMSAPFIGDGRPGPDLKYRFSGFSWGNSLAMVHQFWWKTRRVRIDRFQPDLPQNPIKTVFDYSSEDRYAHPGYFASRPNQWGRPILRQDKEGRSLFLTGRGASPEGDRPFVDRYDLASGKTNRLWRSAAPYYEAVVAFVDEKNQMVLTSREGKKVQPNYFLRNLKSGKLRQVTFFKHPFPVLKDVEKQIVRYRRPDGVDLSGNLYLPVGWKKAGDPLPVLMWAYPQEFKSRSAAGQLRDSPYRFMRISPYSTLLWITQGYAVFDNPTMPIVGEGKQEPNDTYIEQLVASAQAAVDKLVELGIADRKRVAIGGHSYGAFMTANLLAHSRIFAAGIARSGAYNRTLTPFGFQAEERLFWQAPEIYMKMSPFMYAQQVKDPILLIHGQADDNSGTFPIQTERFYHALKGNGATVRMVLLPNEAHGYDARESVMHMLWETYHWLEKYVKRSNSR